MSPNEQTATAYLSRFQASLERYRVPNAAEITADLSNHISEAAGSGKPINAALDALGTPDELARAYAMELLVSPPQVSRYAGALRILRILSLMIAGGFLSFCMVSTLGVVGLSLVVAGPAMVLGAILLWMGEHPWWISSGPLSPLEVALLGILMLILGCASLWLLWRYARATVSAARKLLPLPMLKP